MIDLLSRKLRDGPRAEQNALLDEALEERASPLLDHGNGQFRRRAVLSAGGRRRSRTDGVDDELEDGLKCKPCRSDLLQQLPLRLAKPEQRRQKRSKLRRLIIANKTC